MAASWAGKQSSTQLTSITTEQFFSGLPQPLPNEIVHIEVDVDFPVTPTDNCVVSVYANMTGTPDWDDTPIDQFVIDNGTDPNKVSRSYFGYYQYRVGVKRDGTTDTITSADMAYRIGTMA